MNDSPIDIRPTLQSLIGAMVMQLAEAQALIAELRRQLDALRQAKGE